MADRLFRWLNVASLAMLLLVLGAVGAMPQAGASLAEVYAWFPVILTPAPYSFAIWSLIYIGLTGFTLLSFFPPWQQKAEIRAIGPWFACSCAFHSLWLLLLNSGLYAASVFMLAALLVSTTVVYMRTRSALYLYSRAGGGHPGSSSWSRDTMIRLWVQLPFSLYTGWLCFMLLWCGSMALQANGWSGWGLSPALWAVCGMLLLFGAAVYAGKAHRDIPLMLAIVWALIAVAVNQPDAQIIRIVAWLLAGALSAHAALLVRIRALARS